MLNLLRSARPHLVHAGRPRRRRRGLLLVAAALAGCASSGTGTGTVAPENTAASVTWNSAGASTSGTMSVALAGDGTYSGPFVQVSAASRLDSFEPMWRGWRRGWGDWGFPETAFVTHYSGRVVANLGGPNKDRMRCRFVLNDPSAGLSGGGQGECQLAAGRRIDIILDRR